MTSAPSIDGVLIQWGERLFYPRNRVVRSQTPRLHTSSQRAALIRSRIETTVRRAPQVMVKVTGGGRGMKAIAAHFRYISKNGRLDIEDDRGVVERGKEALAGIERQWKIGGSLIENESPRREAFNIMLSMPRGTDPLALQRAARDFAKIEFADHRYVMVLHDHQANPHVHLSVRAESKHGKRLNPRKTDLHRWRETFAEKLRERGIDAEATRQATRGAYRRSERLWAHKTNAVLNIPPQGNKTGKNFRHNRSEALHAWAAIARALGASGVPADRQLSASIERYVRQMPIVQVVLHQREKAKLQERSGATRTSAPQLERKEPEVER